MGEGQTTMGLHVARLYIFVVLFLSFLSQASQSEDAWMFRGNPAHSGVYEAAGVATFSGVKWKVHTGGMVIGSPAVVEKSVYFGSTDGNFYAVDAESGRSDGSSRRRAGFRRRRRSRRRIVYFGAYDGNFYAVDAATGALKWKFQTEGERRFSGKHLHGVQPVAETMPDPFDCYLSSPVVWNGAVYFGSGDGNIYSLNAASGALNWKFKTGDVVHASPAIADGTLFVGSWDSYFYALDAATGAGEVALQNWRRSRTHTIR